MNIISRACSSYGRYQKGIGLIELLISMVVGLLVMAGVVQLFSTTTQNANANAGISRIQENTRYAFSRIVEDISQSGSLGCMSSPSVIRNSRDASEPIVENLLGVAGVPVADNSLYDYLTIINGFSSLTDNLSGDATNGTDILRVRYLDHAVRIKVNTLDSRTQVTLDTTGANSDFIDTLDVGDVVGVSNCARAAIFVLTSKPSSSTGIVSITTGDVSNIYNAKLDMKLGSFPSSSSRSDFTLAKYSQFYLYAGDSGAYEYFIGDSPLGECNVTTAQQNCSLFRRKGGVKEEIVQGVHNMEVQYGTTDSAGSLTYQNAAAVTDWRSVDRLKITMMFNSIENAQASGNNLSSLITKEVTRTINLYNQL
ncbi:MAG: PilW family protein [Cellvibrionaceae bacterium]